MGRFFELFRRWLPDPASFAVVLTVLSVIGAFLAGESAGRIISAWGRGFSSIFTFAFQMALVLATGYAVGVSPLMGKFLTKIAEKVSTPASVYFIVTLAGCIFSMISWGWIVLTAILARELGRRVKGVNWAFLGACVYVSFLPWHGGLSGSIPLLLATPDNFLIKGGLMPEPVSVKHTLLSPLNLAVELSFLITLPFLMWFAGRKIRGDSFDLPEEEFSSDALKEGEEKETFNLSEFLLKSWAFGILTAFIPALFVAKHFYLRGFDINLNIMIITFLALGLFLHGTLESYSRALREASSDIYGILFLFPFYGGIMGLFIHTSLGEKVTGALVNMASPETFPLIAFLTGALMNIPVSSGGGEWAVVGPSVVKASHLLGVPVEKSAMAVAYGDSVTNLIQPFWTLAFMPLFARGTPLQARDIMVYTAPVCVFALFLGGTLILIF